MVNNNAMLQETFFSLVGKYTSSVKVAGELWEEIEQHYNGKGRYYHTLGHLRFLLKALTEVRPYINNWEATLFTLYYHDIVYNPLRHDNEEESAVFAQKRMGQLGVPAACIEACTAQILATQKHLEADNDTNYFTDADLAILGTDEVTYVLYCEQIRMEYAIYPDILYKPGRKKVLQHFLQMDHIFKTAHFRQKFELQARKNLQKELEQL